MKPKKLLARGSGRIAKIALTGGIIAWLGNWLSKKIIPIFQDQNTFFLVLGLIALILISILIVGSIPTKWYTRVEEKLARIPLFGGIYTIFTNIFKLSSSEENFSGVYWVTLEDPGIYILGLQTNDVPQIIDGKEHFPIVIIPALGTTSVLRWYPRERLKPATMPVKKALTLILSGGGSAKAGVEKEEGGK